MQQYNAAYSYTSMWEHLLYSQGGQGLLLLMEFKFLITMTSPQNIVTWSIIKNCHLINIFMHATIRVVFYWSYNMAT